MTTPQDFTYRGQLYSFVRQWNHTNRWGFPTKVNEFATHCPDCGQPFLMATTRRFPPNYPRRRCDQCKNPHKRVPVVPVSATPG